MSFSCCSVASARRKGSADDAGRPARPARTCLLPRPSVLLLLLLVLFLPRRRRRIVHSLARGVVGGGGEDQGWPESGLKDVASGSTSGGRGVVGEAVLSVGVLAARLLLLLKAGMGMLMGEGKVEEEEEGEGFRSI